MKNNVKKQILLFSAFAMLLSTVPMQAEEAIVEEEMVAAPADVQEEVAAKRGFFSGWTPSALQRRMRTAMHDLDREWKPFITCVKKRKGECSQQAKTVRNLIATILALIPVTAIGILGIRKVKRWAEEQAEERYPRREAAPAATPDDKLIIAAEDYAAGKTEAAYPILASLLGPGGPVLSEGALRLARKILTDKGYDTDFSFIRSINARLPEEIAARQERFRARQAAAVEEASRKAARVEEARKAEAARKSEEEGLKLIGIDPAVLKD